MRAFTSQAIKPPIVTSNANQVWTAAAKSHRSSCANYNDDDVRWQVHCGSRCNGQKISKEPFVIEPTAAAAAALVVARSANAATADLTVAIVFDDDGGLVSSRPPSQQNVPKLHH